MRKETTARLLLSLFTAFIMVVGALGAALPDIISEEDASPSVVLDEADSEQELKLSEAGDAPASAFGQMVNVNTPQPEIPPMVASMPGMEMEDPNVFEIPSGPLEVEETEEESSLNEHGTRNPDTVDANGPYGTGIPFDPYYEGEPITFEATIEPEDEHDNYQFRWDIDGDGMFDGPGPAADDYFGEYGESDITHTFYDDVQGDALVQAWDGSWISVDLEGRLMNGATSSTYLYISSTQTTRGYTFEVTQDVDVTQLGVYRNEYNYPSSVYNLRIWSDPRTVVAEITYPSLSTGSWTWHDLSTPATLSPGTEYMITEYIYYYYGPILYSADMPSESDDGIIQTGSAFYSFGNRYPTIPLAYYSTVDFNYEYTLVLPDVLEDTSEILVWNREPIAMNPSISQSTTREGSEDVWYTAEMVDLGLDDDWEYQWDFGDGTQSDWYPVPTYSGGMDILIVHGCDNAGWNFRSAFIDPIMELLGGNAKRVEYYDYSWQGNDAAPDLDYVLEFDVVLHAGFAVGSSSGTHDDTGDVLADASDAGVGVVQMANTFTPDSYGLNWGTKGRWLDEEYTCIPYGAPLTGSSGTSSFEMDWWDIHPITDGPFGTVTEHGAFLVHDSRGVTTWATLLSTYDSGHTQLAYTEEGHHGVPGSGRIVAFNTYPFGLGVYDYNEGDYIMITANALFWASQQPLAVKLSQPYTLPPITHIYPDDHPEHVTPSDQITPSVRVRDDDHCKDLILGRPLTYLQDFNGPWGTYGDNPPVGWTIEDYTAVGWDTNDWYRYYWGTTYGFYYGARVYYTPDEDQDEELISPEIDISGEDEVTIYWSGYAYLYYTQQTANLDYRLDGGAWITGDTYTGSGYRVDASVDVTTGGADTLEFRFHLVDWGASTKYWYVGFCSVEDSDYNEIFEEDFEGSWGPWGDNPPTGWTIIDNGAATAAWGTDDWHKRAGNTYYGLDGTPTACLYYSYGGSDDWLISPEFDLNAAAYDTARMQFRTWVYMYNPYSEDMYCWVKYRLDGGPWEILDTYERSGTSGTTNIQELAQHDISFALGHTVQFAFHRYKETGYVYYYWYVDNFFLEAIPELKHVYGMSPFVEGPPVTVMNVWPTIIVPEEIPEVVTEQTDVVFEGIELDDVAMKSGTEELWYRIDTDDGMVTDWTQLEVPVLKEFKLLVYHSLGTTEWQNIVNALTPLLPLATVIDVWEFRDPSYPGSTGLGPAPDDYLNQYDVIFTGINWAPFDGDAIGDGLAQFCDQGGGVVETVAAFHSTPGWWGITGRWRDEGYQTLRHSTALGSGSINILDPSHEIMDGPAGVVTPFTQNLVIGSPGETPGTTLLAEYPSYPAVAIHDTDTSPGKAKIAGLNVFYYPGYFGAPETIMAANAIMWASYGSPEPIPTFEKSYLDNGIYYPDVQVIDDDMWWDWAPGDSEPTFVGPNRDPSNPGADPEDWIAHNYIPVEVLNIDPVITAKISAYAQLDMRIRMSGTKTHEATMTLFENGADIGGTSVTRVPGSPNIGILGNVKVMVTKDFTYSIVIDVDPNGDGGANPTWIFDMVFPDGKYKEFKHTFNDEHGWSWTITDSMLKGALLGHDIIFEAEADDVGSDDLAFVWNFGDSTPHGIHLFANVDQTTAVDAVSDEATLLFDQLPGRDAAFDKDTNSKRTPNGQSMSATDSISHVFDDSQPYYYYVTLVVMDDDVDDDYPSTQLHPSPGCDMAFVEVDFR